MSWAEEQDWFGMEDALALRGFDDPEDAIEQGYWIQNDWEPIALTAMTEQHLRNSIRMIESGRLNRPWALPYLNKELKRREQAVLNRRKHYRVTIKEIGKDGVLTPQFHGEIDRAGLIKFFGLNEPDVEWYKIEELTDEEVENMLQYGAKQEVG